MTLHVDTSRPDQVKIRFSLPLDEPPGTVSVVGSFNDWTPGLDELTADTAGERSVTIGLPYNTTFAFRYLGDNALWFDEPDADATTQHGSIIRPIRPPIE